MALTHDDNELVNKAIEIALDLGIKVEIDAMGDVWSRASLRWNRGVEHLGRATDIDAFKSEFRKRWYAGSC